MKTRSERPETGRAVGLAVKRRISRGGNHRGTEGRVDSFETKCHLPSALTLSQSVNHERQIRETQMLGFAEYQMKPRHVKYLKTNAGGVLGFMLPVTCCSNSMSQSVRTLV